MSQLVYSIRDLQKGLLTINKSFATHEQEDKVRFGKLETMMHEHDEDDRRSRSKQWKELSHVSEVVAEIKGFLKAKGIKND